MRAFSPMAIASSRRRPCSARKRASRDGSGASLRHAASASRYCRSAASGLTERGHQVAGEREICRRRRRREHRHHDVEGAASIAAGGGDSGQAGRRERMSWKHVAGVEELAARVRQSSHLQIELAELRAMPRQRLRIVRARRLRGHLHRAKRARQIALQLARVGHARVCRGRRLDRGHAIERVEGGVVFAALEVRVADHAVRPRHHPARIAWQRSRLAKRVGEAMLRQIGGGEHARARRTARCRARARRAAPARPLSPSPALPETRVCRSSASASVTADAASSGAAATVTRIVAIVRSRSCPRRR